MSDREIIRKALCYCAIEKYGPVAGKCGNCIAIDAALPADKTEIEDEACICRGNWRAIVKDHEANFGKRFTDDHGQEWIFSGVVHASDDYYYLMTKPHSTERRLVTCVARFSDLYSPITEDKS